MGLKSLVFLGLVAIAMGAVVEIPKPTPLGSVKQSTAEPPVEIEWIDSLPLVIRKVRSPDGGSAKVEINHDDKSGTSGTVSAQQNIWSSSDGKTSIDASGSYSKNFDHGNSDQNIGLGISHKW